MDSTPAGTLLTLGAEAMAAGNYELAVDHYSQLCQLKNLENNGKDDPDCMYLYGKALFENAVANSDVLGGARKGDSAEAQEGSGTEAKEPVFTEELAQEEDDDEGVASEGVPQVPAAEEEEEGEEDDEEVPVPEGDSPNANGDDDEDDFSIAWDILDLTRVLYEEQLESLSKTNPLPEKTPFFESDKLSDIEKTLAENPSLHTCKKLADTLDLLGELSLETENFNQATSDFERMLDLKLKLYPLHTGQVTEAYYKTSLAWEFNSADSMALSKAIGAMESAIRSIVTRTVLAKQTGEEVDSSLIAEMKARLIDLKSGDLQIKEEKDRIMKGIMGEIASDAAPTAETKVNDLSGMVKKRKAPKGPRGPKASPAAKKSKQ